MSKESVKDPASEKYEAPEPAGPDPEAEAQELARSIAVTHGAGGMSVPSPIAGGLSDAEEETAGYHRGPPERVNCPACGHSHQVSFAECLRCGASLKAAKKAAGAR